MKPVIALVGRPNVGKSTLFNQLTRTRDALVADLPGLTRDRKYGSARLGDRHDSAHGERDVILIDTGGLSGEDAVLDERMAEQTWKAVDEADVLVFLVDARAGLTGADITIAERLRRKNKPMILVTNKMDGADEVTALAEFSGLGLGEPVRLVASHGRGMLGLAERIIALLPPAPADMDDDAIDAKGMMVGIIGRPNVGKSTLVNRLLGEERMVTMDMPGTTRDSIFIPWEHNGKPVTLIDTAGVRRRGRVDNMIEKFSVVKTLQAVDAAQVVILVVDAQEGIVEQDLHLLGFVLERGCALIIAVNKWDGLTQDQRERVKTELDRRLDFIDYAEILFISALHGSNVGLLMDKVEKAHASAGIKLSTPRLTEALEVAQFRHQPPLVNGRRIKLRYAHQGGRFPPTVIIHGKQTDRLPGAYKRYLEKFFRDQFHLYATPVRLQFKTDENPYQPETQRNTKSLMEHLKEKRERRISKGKAARGENSKK
ncbi:MAG: ribosome biogenesis GTPase Der [Pseudomonadota bacterium]